MHGTLALSLMDANVVRRKNNGKEYMMKSYTSMVS